MTFELHTVALVLFTAAGIPRGADDDSALRIRVATVLVEPGEPGRPGSGSSGMQLAQLGVEAIPVLFETLRAGRIPPIPGDDSRSADPLSDEQQASLLEALGIHGTSRVTSLLEEKVVEHASHDDRVAAVRVLGHIGARRELELVVRAVARPDGTSRMTPALEDVFGQAVEEILRRDPQAHGSLRWPILEYARDIRSTLIRATGEVGSPLGLELLSDILGFDEASDLGLLVQIGRIGQVVPKPVSASVRAPVRSYLDHHEPLIVKEAARALGKLQDYDAVNDLITLLESEDAGIRESALWALHGMTGLRFPENAERWRAWALKETAWFESEAPRLFRNLSRSNRAGLVHSLNQLVGRRYRRHLIAHEIEVVLQDGRPDIRGLGCAALGQIGASSSAEALVAALEDRDDSVVRAACSALTAISGVDLPPHVKPWRAWLNEQGPRRESTAHDLPTNPPRERHRE